MTRWALAAALTLCAGHTAAQEAEAESAKVAVEVDPEIFELALADFYEGDYAQAAAGFWGYIHFGEPGAESYEWSQYFLAESLRKLGLTHGAVQYYYMVAKTRSRPEILPDALGRLEALTRRHPFSETLIYEDLLYDSEFGFLPPHLGDWVHYIQGLFDYRNDFIDWGDRHFEQVRPTSPYALWAMYVKGAHALKNGKDDTALAIFDAIVDSPQKEPAVKNKAYLALARLLFDMERPEDALAMYNHVEQTELSFEQASLLLEKAWSAYLTGDRRKAMGLLHALEAPSYQKFFLPDAFVLRGLIFKDLCHFIPAKRVVRAFRFRYQRPLDLLRRRMPMEKIPGLVEAATQEGAIARRTAFLRVLEDERRKIEDYDSMWEDVALDEHLRRLYDLEIREQSRQWRIEFEEAADRMALELLEAEEQVSLLDYEIGLDIFKRLKVTDARRTVEESLVIPYDSANVYYEWDTEYWNDELHSYQYFITSRCFESGEAP